MDGGGKSNVFVLSGEVVFFLSLASFRGDKQLQSESSV